jgi:chromosome segregation ATPase
MASSNPSHKQEHGAHESRSEQFITARNEQGQFIPMGGRDYGRDYGASGSKDYSRDYGASGSKEYSGQSSGKDYGQSASKDFNQSASKEYASTANKSEDKTSDVGNMLRHIESLESKLANKEKQLHEAQQRVEKFSARTREGMQSALDSLMKKWMDACETKDEKCKEQFKQGMEKLVHNSAEENGVWQMMVAASALHQRQEHDLDKLRMENNTLKQRIDGHFATPESRTAGALGKRKADGEPQLDVSNEAADDLWASFASECGAF